MTGAATGRLRAELTAARAEAARLSRELDKALGGAARQRAGEAALLALKGQT